MRYLVLHDVDAIQKYVLGTNRLREIRGASALIDSINGEWTGKEVDRNHGDPIFFGGGGAAATFGDLNSAKRFSDLVSREYVTKTWTSSSTGVIVDYDESSPDGFGRAFQQAHAQLRRKKAGLRRETQLLTGAYLKRCQSCSVYPVAHHDTHFPEADGQFICQSCKLKRESSQQNSRVHAQIRSLLARPIEFPRDIEDIGGAAEPKGYIGLVYADGNRMGDWLRNVFSEGDECTDKKKALKQFSRMIDEATRGTISEVLAELYRQDQNVRALVPLCGGDDLMVIAPANDALEIALKYLEGFQKYISQNITPQLKYLLGDGEHHTLPSACAGVVIAKEGAPLSALFDLAHDLCSRAKKLNYDLWKKDQKETPCVDFQVITTPHWSSVEDTRSNQLVIEDRLLTCRPYTAEGARRLIDSVIELKQVRFPQGKLHELYRSLWKGKLQAMLEYLTMYVRARGADQQTALLKVQQHLGTREKLLWIDSDGQTKTPYGDLVEIYPFVGRK